MEKTVKPDIKQREHLVALIESKKQCEKTQLRDRAGLSPTNNIRQLLFKKGGKALFERLEKDRDAIGQFKASFALHESELESLGFRISSDGSLALRYDAPDELQQELKKLERAAAEPIEKALMIYDIAISNIWTAESSDHLQNAMASLFSIK